MRAHTSAAKEACGVLLCCGYFKHVSLVSVDEACKLNGCGGIWWSCGKLSLLLRSTVGTGRERKICHSQRPSTAAQRSAQGVTS